jgi:hypothetical protein
LDRARHRIAAGTILNQEPILRFFNLQLQR